MDPFNTGAPSEFRSLEGNGLTAKFDILRLMNISFLTFYLCKVEFTVDTVIKSNMNMDQHGKGNESKRIQFYLKKLPAIPIL